MLSLTTPVISAVFVCDAPDAANNSRHNHVNGAMTIRMPLGSVLSPNCRRELGQYLTDDLSQCSKVPGDTGAQYFLIIFALTHIADAAYSHYICVGEYVERGRWQTDEAVREQYDAMASAVEFLTAPSKRFHSPTTRST